MSKKRYRDKVVEKDEDTLLQIGKEGKEGEKNFKEYMKAEEKEEEEKHQRIIEELSGKKRRIAYNNFLADILYKRLGLISWKSGWIYRVAGNDKGVVMELQSPDMKFFRTAFKSTGMGDYDLNACELFAVRAEYTMEEYLKKTEGGIILPNG